MSSYIDNAIGGWIRNAEKTGELKDNPYRGKKLDLEDYFKTPAEHRMGMKILKDANCLPPAVQMMQLIDKKQKEFESSEDPETKEVLRKEIMALKLKKDLLIEANN